jgi:formamidopyrimidine-DNA glycosylase
MPEMPEVETLARKLRKIVIGKRISGIALSGLPLRKPVPGTFTEKLRGRSIRKILRRGKYLVVELEPKLYWLIHLGMSGRLLYHSGSFKRISHSHAVISFSDGTFLEYRDPRRFGLLDVYEVTQPDRIPELRLLGKDPLSRGFGAAWLQPLLRESRQEVKVFLLDQSRIAGLGNIYACEALYLAGIHPERRCFTLTSREVHRLADSTRSILRLAVRNRGTSFSDFIDLEGNPGKNQYYLNVFQKDGEPCRNCGSPIQRIRQGNRSTFFCPECQKRKEGRKL